MTVCGYTLIEILVVILLLALFATITAPRYGPAFERFGFEVQVYELVHALRRQRMTAIVTQQSTVLEIDPSSNSYRVGSLSQWKALPGGIVVRMLGAREELFRGRTRYRFYPDGSATGGQIVLSKSGLTFVVDIDWLTGRVSIDAGKNSSS